MINKIVPVDGMLASAFSRSNALGSVASKMVKSSRSRAAERRLPDTTLLSKIANETLLSQTDAINTLEIHPELELAGNILVACIVSPNDLSTSKIVWKTDTVVGDAELNAKLIKCVQEFFENEYDINKKIHKWIYKALFLHGSYPTAVIPESALDEVINGPIKNPVQVSFESAEAEINKLINKRLHTFNRNKTKLGISTSFESNVDYGVIIPKKQNSDKLFPNISFTCDVEKLKVGHFNLAKRAYDLSMTVTSSFEDASPRNGELSTTELAALFNARRHSGASRFTQIKDNSETKRENIGHPMEIDFPPESCVPVINPGNPSEHLGYIVLLDENKNPISKQSAASTLNRLGGAYSGGVYGDNSAAVSRGESSIIDNISDQLGGKQKNKMDSLTYNEIYTHFSNTVEKSILSKLKTSLHESNVDLGDVNNFYRIMFSRTLENANTEVIFIPESLMTYISYNYNDYGVGISLLEKAKTLTCLKSVITFSNAMNNIHSSIPRTNYEIRMDETDENPDKTLAQVLHNIQAGLSNGYPFDQTNPRGIVQSLLMAAINISVTGHPEYNDTQVTATPVDSIRQPVDQEYEKAMSDRVYKALTLLPELIDSSTSIDFAIQQANSNLMFNKTIKEYQQTTNPLITDKVCKYVANSGTLTSKLLKIILEHKLVKESKAVEDYEKITDRELVDDNDDDKLANKRKTAYSFYLDFLCALRCELPAPEDTKINNQLTAFTSQTEAIEKVVDSLFSDDKLSIILGDEGSQYGSVIKDMIKSHLTKSFMVKNNLFTEVLEIIDVKDSNVLKEMESGYLKSNGIEMTILKAIKDLLAKNNSINTTTDDSSDSDISESDSGYNEDEL